MGPMPKLAEVLASSFTVYTYDRRGRGESGDVGPYAVDREVDDLEAMIAHAGGAAFVCGASSGGALALKAACGGAAIEKLTVYEAPFIVDDTHAPQPEDWVGELERLVLEERRGEAVTQFLRFVGMPAVFAAVMRVTPVWRKLKDVAHTLPYDVSIVAEHQRGVPFEPGEWDAVTVPTVVFAGGKSPAWMRNGMGALADALPDAEHRTLPGQTHMLKAKVVGPALAEFLLR
jgi:pimeloyl-ACP methyl ester carboxylesterase